MLLTKEVDGALLTESEGNDPILYRPLFVHRQYLLVYKGHPLYECDRIHHAMLKDETLIIESSCRQMIKHFTHACMNKGFLPNCTVQSPDVNFCYRLCSQEEGLVVTMDIGYANLNYPNVRLIPFDEHGYISQVYFSRRNQPGNNILELENDIFSMLTPSGTP